MSIKPHDCEEKGIPRLVTLMQDLVFNSKLWQPVVPHDFFPKHVQWFEPIDFIAQDIKAMCIMWVEEEHYVFGFPLLQKQTLVKT